MADSAIKVVGVSAPLMTLMGDVADFHRAFGHPISDKPVMLSPERVEKRANWMDEEVREFREADTIAKQVDASMDLIYFAVGNLVEIGVIPDPIWQLIQAANMAKLGPDGKPIYGPDGKVRKPEGWTPPDPLIEAEVQAQIDAAERRAKEAAL